MAVKSKLSPEAFKAACRTAGSGTCLLVSLFRALSPDDVKHVRAAFADPSIQHSAIQRVLSEIGFTGSINTIRRHRDFGCKHCGIPSCR